MSSEFWVCSQPAGSGPCGARFHRDEREEYIAHLEAHGLDVHDAWSEAPEWWEEEGGFSLPTTTAEVTPVDRTQFGDGSDEARRAVHKNTRAMAAASRHDVPARAFEGAIEYSKALAGRRSPALQAPEVGLLAGKLNAGERPAVSEAEAAGGLRKLETPERVKKGRKDMATTKNPMSKYAKAGVVNLSAPTVKGQTGAPRICVTTGRGFTDVKAITQILALVQKNEPSTVITNQGRWEGDRLVASVARNMGLAYEETLPKFLEARRAGQPLIGENERMTPEQDAEFGFKALQQELAETCTELHVFGTPSGPQRGLIDAFNDAGKSEAVARWGSALE